MKDVEKKIKKRFRSNRNLIPPVIGVPMQPHGISATLHMGATHMNINIKIDIISIRKSFEKINTLRQNFFKRCRLVFEDDVCRRCGKHLRPAHNEDFCFLKELPHMDASMIANVFEDEKIIYARLPKREIIGFSSMTMSPQKEQIFVAFAHLERAKEILTDFLS